jgi:hypothetical protein
MGRARERLFACIFLFVLGKCEPRSVLPTRWKVADRLPRALSPLHHLDLEYGVTPGSDNTMRVAQAPTHSFPLRLAPAGAYWWAGVGKKRIFDIRMMIHSLKCLGAR